MSSTDFLALLGDSLADGSFVALSLTRYRGAQPALKTIDIRRILVKRQEKLSFTYHYKTRDEVKNYPHAESLQLLQSMLAEGFEAAHLCTTARDARLDKKSGTFTLTESAPSRTEAASLSHDREKKRLISAQGQGYLQALNITDAKGNVFKNAQDKFRQINKYVELLSGLLKNLPAQDVLRVVDMGAGKGYLTFALYDYLTNTLGLKAQVTGVEFRADMVALCNRIAADAGFEGLRFVEGSIADYDCSGAHVVIALHACDTATDDAIFSAIQARAELIVVAPCCHKQIRRQMEQQAVRNDLDFMTRFGTLLERQAEMVTDAMRAQLMEYAGYKTNLFEFISDAHTPKNVMIVATRSGAPQPSIAAAIAAEQRYFGIGYHHLGRLLGL
ncbi:MAG: SAM-dependent methyltransferase [Pseudomonadota bacterium]